MTTLAGLVFSGSRWGHHQALGFDVFLVEQAISRSWRLHSLLMGLPALFFFLSVCIYFSDCNQGEPFKIFNQFVSLLCSKFPPPPPPMAPSSLSVKIQSSEQGPQVPAPFLVLRQPVAS